MLKDIDVISSPGSQDLFASFFRDNEVFNSWILIPYSSFLSKFIYIQGYDNSFLASNDTLYAMNDRSLVHECDPVQTSFTYDDPPTFHELIPMQVLPQVNVPNYFDLTSNPPVLDTTDTDIEPVPMAPLDITANADLSNAAEGNQGVLSTSEPSVNTKSSDTPRKVSK